VIEKSGAWFSFETERIGQGKENTRKFLQDNPKILNNIEKQIRTKFNLKNK